MLQTSLGLLLSLRITLTTYTHHASHSGRIGAVLDNRFRAYVTEHLRVMDAWEFSYIAGLFVALHIYMASQNANNDFITTAVERSAKIVDRL